MRLGDLDALKKSFNADDFKGFVIRKVIDMAPTIEPVRGEWEQDGVYQRCSKCFANYETEDCSGNEWVFNFCPNCGADMRGAK